MREAFDVVGLGLAAIDDLVRVARYPHADERCRSSDESAAAAASTPQRSSPPHASGRAPHTPASWVRTKSSRFVLDALRSKGVNVDHVRVHPGAGPVLSFIVIDDAEHTRTIFYDLSPVVGPDEDWLPDELLRSTRVLLVDNFRLELTIRAARVARQAGAAVVADLEGAIAPGLDDLLGLVDHLLRSLSV